MNKEKRLIERRKSVLERKDLQASVIPSELSRINDEWLAELFDNADGEKTGMALVAVGGYGRQELAPGSDLDLILTYKDGYDADSLANQIWYPIWDEGLKLGHAVRTVERSLRLAETDLETATALLDARHIAGDPAITGELIRKSRAQWKDLANVHLPNLSKAVKERHRSAGEVAFLLEPDLKAGRGGLRDIQAIRWLALADMGIAGNEDDERLRDAHKVLLEARVELHRLTGKRGDVLLLEEQDQVATALKYSNGDELVARIAASARVVAYLSDEAWRFIDTKSDLDEITEIPVAGLKIKNNEIVITGDPGTDPLLILHAALAAAQQGVPIARTSLERLSERQGDLPDPWPHGAKELFVELLRSGQQAIPVIESLDFYEVWTRLIPEWEPNRSRPQRNVYHRFTVDRHLLETVAEAARLTQRVQRPDLLLISALLHDVGKGYPGDHSEVGMRLIEKIALRCGFPDTDVRILMRLVEHHLLLPDVATRRDIDDEQTLALVAESVESVEFLELLDALTEADSIATGPLAWGDWKAKLLESLTKSTAQYISGSGIQFLNRRSFVTEDIEILMSEGGTRIAAELDVLTIVAPDKSGVFSRAAGALALSGLDILQADAYSSAAGMAASQFRIASPLGSKDWEPVIEDVKSSLVGRLAIDARIAQRSKVYKRRTALAAVEAPTIITFDTELATDATIIEIRTEDRLGVLYHVTRVLAEMGLDIRYAKIQTLSNEVVDSFYVTGWEGPAISVVHQAEIELALSHALSQID
jgi:[protein-PII] uridylyltransferase